MIVVVVLLLVLLLAAGGGVWYMRQSKDAKKPQSPSRPSSQPEVEQSAGEDALGVVARVEAGEIEPSVERVDAGEIEPSAMGVVERVEAGEIEPVGLTAELVSTVPGSVKPKGKSANPFNTVKYGGKVLRMNSKYSKEELASIEASQSKRKLSAYIEGDTPKNFGVYFGKWN